MRSKAPRARTASRGVTQAPFPRRACRFPPRRGHPESAASAPACGTSGPRPCRTGHPGSPPAGSSCRAGGPASSRARPPGRPAARRDGNGWRNARRPGCGRAPTATTPSTAFRRFSRRRSSPPGRGQAAAWPAASTSATANAGPPRCRLATAIFGGFRDAAGSSPRRCARRSSRRGRTAGRPAIAGSTRRARRRSASAPA